MHLRRTGEHGPGEGALRSIETGRRRLSSTPLPESSTCDMLRGGGRACRDMIQERQRWWWKVLICRSRAAAAYFRAEQHSKERVSNPNSELSNSLARPRWTGPNIKELDNHVE